MGQRWIWLGALALLVALAAFAGLTAVRWAVAYRQLLEGRGLMVTAEARIAQEGLGAMPETLDSTEVQVREARGKMVAARRTLRQDPTMRLIRRLPWLGDQAQAALAVAEVGVLASDAALEAVEALRRFDGLQGRDGGSLGEMALAYLEEIEPQMEVISARLAAIREKLGNLTSSPWPPLSGVVATVRRDVAEAEEVVTRYHHARKVAPDLLGFDGPRRYLVLGQDNTELFPTGGVIAVYGVLPFQGGRLAGHFFEDVGSLTEAWQARSDGEYVEPPPPLRRYLLRDWTWNIGVSNWSPDFAIAARQALFFYERAGQPPVDGVIGLDFAALEGLLSLTGPLLVADYGVTITAENAVEELLVRTRHPQRASESRYAFASAAAGRILEAVFALEGERWDELLDTLQRLSRERHLFVYSRDQEVQASLQALGWAGDLASPPVGSDFLMVVEASVHSTKLNWVIDEAAALRVQLDKEGGAHHTLTLSYANTVDRWARGRDPALVYDLMLSGFYGGYVRVLAPPQSSLEGVWLDGAAAGVEEIGQELGHASFGRYFPLPAGAQARLTFSYWVPGVVEGRGRWREYHLYIQKQAGTRAIPLRIDIALPEGAKVREVALDGQALPKGDLSIETDLRVDRELSVQYEE